MVAGPHGKLLALAVATLVVATMALVVYERAAPAVAEAVFAGRAPQRLSARVLAHASADPEHRDAAYYVRNGRMALARALMLGILLEGALIVLFRRRQTFGFLRAYLLEPAHPLGVAVLRIVMFGLILSIWHPSRAAFYSGLPPVLLSPPPGLGWLPVYLPIDPTTVAIVRSAFLPTCIAAMLGFWTRTSSLLTLGLFTYLWAVPQLYGKVGHSQFLLWGVAIVAVARSGDVFSVDAAIAAWRRADRDPLTPPVPASHYGLPLRALALVLGGGYFAAGFWKLWRGGPAWVTATNLQSHLYLKWTELDGWLPLLRVDAYPTLLFLGALFTIVFELSFIVLVLFRPLRLVAAAAGVVFHTSIKLAMHINFASLSALYVVLLDVAAIGRRVGRALFGDPLTLVYEPSCRACRRVVAFAQGFDLFGTVQYHARSEGGAAHARLELETVVQGKAVRGPDAARQVERRVPVVWLVRHLLPEHENGCVTPPPPAPLPGVGALVPSAAVAGALLLGNSLVGAHVIHLEWPFATFPSFAWMAAPTTTRLAVETVDEAGEVAVIDTAALSYGDGAGFEPDRITGLVRSVIASDATVREARLLALWRVLIAQRLVREDVRLVRFFEETVTTDPERRADPPLTRRLVFEFRPGGSAVPS